MGFYWRKSVRVGPLRFNLSKSGIGVSAGIKGLRVGFGPRGNYVHASGGGFQYRTTLSPKAVKAQQTLPKEDQPIESSGRMQEIDSDMELLFQNSSSDELVAEISEKVKRFSFWKWIGAALGGLGFYAHPGFFIAALVICPLVFLWDETRKSVVLFYEFDESGQKKFEDLFNSFSDVLSAKKIWHMEASAEMKDWKRHSGAEREWKRKTTSVNTKLPRSIKANIPIPTIKVGDQQLCFLPDKLLMVSSKGAATVSYSDLNIEVATSRFIESDGVPSDAEVIDHTWQYVNKKGGPDKRFKNNRQFPICAYDAVHFSSSTGLNEIVQVSKRGQFERFKTVVSELSKRAA